MTAPFQLQLDPGLGRALSPASLRCAAAPSTDMPGPRVRAKLWELNGSFHCSVVGTCLTTGELRRVMGKVLAEDVAALSDHELHARAVGLCGSHSPAAKLLHKALDQRHALAVKRFARLAGETAVIVAWDECRRAGDIPGAYWAVLTHPDTETAGLRRAFGDVHMLSHLVGAANRADIRRLTALEAENAVLRDKVERQQLRLQEMRAAHERSVRQLTAASSERVTAPSLADADDALAGLRQLADALQARLDQETGRRLRLQQRLDEAVAARARLEQCAARADARAQAAERELAAVEATALDDTAPAALPAHRVLYVGGRPGAVAAMRRLVEVAGGVLTCHDGGRHDHVTLLPGLISGAELVAFPVDCVSHDAIVAIKRACRQLDKPFLPLRTSGLGSFLAALATTRPDLEASP